MNRRHHPLYEHSMKETVYLESTVISYYSARPSRDIVLLAHQQITHEWWAASQNEFDFFISEIVLEEIARGDREASSKRLELVHNIPILDLTDDIERNARIYSEELAIPARAFGDALHLALACVHKIDYLVTWNCAHLANGRTIKRLNELNRRLNIHNTTICTPEELITGDDYGR